MSEQKEITLKDSTLEMSKRITDAGFKVLKDGNVDAPEGLFEQCLEGSGLNLGDFKKTQGFIAEFAAGLGHSLGSQAVAVMGKHKEVETIATEVAIARDKLGAQINRSQVVNDGKGGQATIHGNLSMKYTTSGAGNSRGELKKVRQSLREQASRILADD